MLDNSKCIEPKVYPIVHRFRSRIAKNNDSSQKWTITSDGQVRSQWTANKYMDLAMSDASNGAKLFIWDCHGGENHKWLRE